METTEFDEIRPYNDEEYPQIIDELLADADFCKVAAAVMPQVPFDILSAQLRSYKTILEFQKACSARLLLDIASKCTKGVSLDHTAIKDKKRAYTYISNHRDIILDSGFLSVYLVEQGMDTVEIAIGDNLLIYPWIKKLVRINKAFIVQRGLSLRQTLESSARMSRYIHHTIQDKNQSVWIAQREGRAKDSSDCTQESVLKMLVLGGEGSVIDRLCNLNIAPLTLSYEYDPCDYLKAQEFQLKRDVEGYKKSRADDLLNMRTGLLGKKGHVHLQVSPCINEQLRQLDAKMPRQELFARIAEMIDKCIHRNYRLYPCNYVAHDLLRNEKVFADHYNEVEKADFENYLNGQIDKIKLPNKDVPFLRERILLMYANPLSNYLAAQ